ELRLAAKVLQAPKDLYEDLLNDILQIRGCAQHPVDEPCNVAAMAEEDLLECGCISRSCASQETVVLGRVRACRMRWHGGKERRRRRESSGHWSSVARPLPVIQVIGCRLHDIHRVALTDPVMNRNLARRRLQFDADDMAIVA